MTTSMIETGVTPARVVAAAEQVNSFLRAQPGFISRQLGLADDGTWRDILYWERRDHVLAAMADVESSPHCASFFGLIDPAQDRMDVFQSLLAATR
jgi:hypothetical protein